ncbi:MAG TPA: AraC family transcriptional regulator [Gemmatimonadales bacterium]|nr:AraC family transcriptional regulator [Gemmatimonadales bacterium]
MTNDSSIRYWQPAPEAARELVCAYLEGSAGQPHLHEEWQFAVVETPSKLSVGAFQRYDAHVDDVTIVHPYDVHSEGAKVSGAPKWHVLYVAPSIVNRLYGGKAPRFFRPVVTDTAAAAELRELLRQSVNGTVAGAEFMRRVARWLEQLLLRHAEDAVAPQALPAVERARAYLQTRPTESIALPEVGAVAGVTISHLVRSFSRRVGLPPSSYHAQVRLARARRLLAEGRSATWVAYECGFADQSHLTRRFKECHGVTPGAFQAQCQAQRRSPAMGESTAA